MTIDIDHPFTLADALDLIDSVVDEFGEDHRSSCIYVDRSLNQPVCILGNVFHRAGVPIEVMGVWGGATFAELIKTDQLPFPITLGAQVVLKAAQKVQDERDLSGDSNCRRTWGEARREALRVAERYLDVMPDQLFLNYRELDEVGDEPALATV